MIIKILILIILSILSGILGRLGGRAKNGSWYDFLSDSKARDVGCSIISIIAFCLCFGFKLKFWWAYIISFGLHWGAFSTYWDNTNNIIFDKICKIINWQYPKDNFYLSGFMSGLALLPLIITYKLYGLYVIRSILLAVTWGLLNKFLPSKFLIWQRDVIEEFLRYFSVVVFYLRR